MKKLKTIALMAFCCLAGLFIGLLAAPFLNGEIVTRTATALATSILALASMVGLYVAYTQLEHLGQIRSEEFIESMNRKFDSERMRTYRRQIYDKFHPDNPDRPKELLEDDLRLMEKVWSYLDTVGFLMKENDRLKNKGLKLWSSNFFNCWRTTEDYVKAERKRRQYDDYMKYFEALAKDSERELGARAKKMRLYRPSQFDVLRVVENHDPNHEP